MQNKIRVLWCGESSVLSTGYATYSREVLQRLFNHPNIEIAEFASYVHYKDNRLANIPWKVYANLPDNNPEENARYNSDVANQFGAWRFEEVCLDFLPHIVCDIRDFWMLAYQDSSPYRRLFYHLIMPTVDAWPQHPQWISLYQRANAVLTYQDWSRDLLRDCSNGRINVVGSAPPCASPHFTPTPDKEKIREQLGFKNKFVVGTVMRNQRRKLYPDLFKSIRMLLDKYPQYNDKLLLYVHTGYPDNGGWDIPSLLCEYGLFNHVCMTYVCQNCRNAFPSLFRDAVTQCKKCGNISAKLITVQTGISEELLAGVYNLFDVYVQYANSEGFGIPMVEAAACGVPIIAMDFSGMSDVVRKLDGFPLEPLILERELETGCNRAMPNNELFIETLVKLLNMSLSELRTLGSKTYNKYKANYGDWNRTANIWIKEILKINPEHHNMLWRSPPRFHQPNLNLPQQIVNQPSQLAKWLIVNVLGEPERLNTYMESRLIKDLTYQSSTDSLQGMYYNELGMLFTGKLQFYEFNLQKAVDQFVNLCNRRNHFEQLRWNKMQNG